jgi:hypothetical protein
MLERLIPKTSVANAFFQYVCLAVTVRQSKDKKKIRKPMEKYFKAE